MKVHSISSSMATMRWMAWRWPRSTMRMEGEVEVMVEWNGGWWWTSEWTQMKMENKNGTIFSRMNQINIINSHEIASDNHQIQGRQSYLIDLNRSIFLSTIAVISSRFLCNSYNYQLLQQCILIISELLATSVDIFIIPWWSRDPPMNSLQHKIRI